MNIITYTTVLQPFSLDYPGAPVPEENLVDFVVQWKITEADTLTTQLGATQFGLISDPPPSSPPFLCQMLFLSQPSHFILAWDGRQIRWLAYPVAWFVFITTGLKINY